MKQCHKCGAEWKGIGQPGLRETCAQCGEDLHCCLNCRLHDPHKPYECRETDIDPVQRKDRQNFCDCFQFKDGSAGASRSSGVPDAKAAFDKLFKK